MKRGILLVFIFCQIVILTGCWDRTEINDLAFVMATGIDKGEKNKYRFSVQIPLPSSMGGSGSSGGGGGTSGEGPFVVLQGTGGNVRQGMEDIQTRLSRKLYFAHRRVTIVGEDLAREGIIPAMNAILIQPQSRVSTFVLIAKGDAVKLLTAQPRMEQFSGEAIREMAKSSIGQTVKDVLLDSNRPGKDTIIPVIEPTGTIEKEKDGKEILMSNFAVFKGDKLRFITSRQEAIGIMWLLEQMTKKTLTFSVSKDQEMTVQIIDNHLKPNMKVVNGNPAFSLKLRVTGILLENEPNLRIEDPDTYHLIIRKMENEIKSQVNSVLEHAHSVGADIFGFGWYLYKHHHKAWQNKWKDGWETQLPELKVDLSVDADIQRTTNSGLIEKD
jgi:Ger(x)C family germination protein